MLPHRQAIHALWHRQHHHIACNQGSSHLCTNPAARRRLAAVPAAAGSSTKPDFDLAVYLDAAAQPQHFVGPVAVANIPGAAELLCIHTAPASSPRPLLPLLLVHRQGPWPGRHCATVCGSAAAGGAAPCPVGGRPRGDSWWVLTSSPAAGRAQQCPAWWWKHWVLLLQLGCSLDASAVCSASHITVA